MTTGASSFVAFYEELRAIAARQLRNERDGHTLRATALVHEAWLRFGFQEPDLDRLQFLGRAARVMRQVLVDHARNRGRQKRGSAARPVTLRETHAVFHRDVSVDALNEALGRLEALSPQQGRIVEKRFFAGMTIPEIGDALSIPPESVKRDWAMARAWLHHALRSV